MEIKTEKKIEKPAGCVSLGVIIFYSYSCTQERKSTDIRAVSRKMTSAWPHWYYSLSPIKKGGTHMHFWYTCFGGVADVGTFVLWDKNCFIGTDYCFILPLQTLANITLHTNVQHRPERVKKRGWVGSERRGGGVGGGQVMAWPAYFDMSRPAKRINIITFCYYCALDASVYKSNLSEDSFKLKNSYREFRECKITVFCTYSKQQFGGKWIKWHTFSINLVWEKYLWE